MGKISCLSGSPCALLSWKFSIQWWLVTCVLCSTAKSIAFTFWKSPGIIMNFQSFQMRHSCNWSCSYRPKTFVASLSFVRQMTSRPLGGRTHATGVELCVFNCTVKCYLSVSVSLVSGHWSTSRYTQLDHCSTEKARYIAKQIVMRTVSTLCVSGIHDRRFLITTRLRTAQNRPLVHRIRIGLTNWIVVFCVERQIWGSNKKIRRFGRAYCKYCISLWRYGAWYCV